jgi:hypothetical protein
MGNITGHNPELRYKVRTNFDLLGCINNILSTQKKLPRSFAKNYVWVASNLSRDIGELNEREVRGICSIFYEFIEYFSKGQANINDDDGCLEDTVIGLAKLSSTAEPNILNIVSGIEFEQSGIIIEAMCHILSFKNK